jgi:hypothetical protein
MNAENERRYRNNQNEFVESTIFGKKNIASAHILWVERQFIFLANYDVLQMGVLCSTFPLLIVPILLHSSSLEIEEYVVKFGRLGRTLTESLMTLMKAWAIRQTG